MQRVAAAVGKRAELRHVIGAAGLGTRPDGGALPAAERLAADDGAGDVAVDVRVADLHAVEPEGDLVGVQGVDAAGQAEIDGVLPFDGGLQVGGAHDAQDRPEALGFVEPGAGLDLVADARRPHQALLIQLAGPQQPLLAGVEPGEAALEFLARRLDQRVHVGAQVAAVADLEGRGGVEDLVHQALGLAGRADQNGQGARRALLPGVAERGVDDVARRQIRVGRRGDDDGVLAARLREHRPVRPPPAEQGGGLRGAGENHRVHPVMRDQRTPGVALVGVGQLNQVRVGAGVGEPVAQRRHGDLRDAHHLRGGGDDHRRTGGQRRHHAADRDGHREVPRRRHHGDAVRGERHAGLVGEHPRAVRVVAHEVDGLADFGVGLRDGLARAVHRGGEQLRAARRQPLADGGQHVGPAVLPEIRPRDLDAGGPVDDAVDVGDVFDERRGLRPRVGVGGHDGLRPLAVGGQGGVGVGFVGEGRGGLGVGGARRGHGAGLALGAAVLGAARLGRDVVAVADGVAETLDLLVHRVAAAGVGHRVEEVLLRGVLLQAAHQVGHRHVEAADVDDRGVQDEPADVGLDGVLLRRRHALQHLRVDLVLDAAGAGQLHGGGHGEQVVAGDADAQVPGMLGAQDAVEEPQVVGVGLGLGGVGGALPAVQVGRDGFHRQVRALDQADLQRGAAVGDALGGEVEQPVQRGDGVRQVRLQHDAGLDVPELLLAEDALEDLERQLQVVVLLHVEVDERRAGAAGLRAARLLRRNPVQRPQRFHEPVDAAVEVPRVQLGDDARRLHRDVVDVRVAQQIHRVLQAAVGLPLAEHRLAQEVEVQLTAAGAGVGKQVPQRGTLGVEDEVPHQLAHAAPRHRHDDAGQPLRQRPAQAHRRAVEGGEEAGH